MHTVLCYHTHRRPVAYFYNDYKTQIQPSKLKKWSFGWIHREKDASESQQSLLHREGKVSEMERATGTAMSEGGVHHLQLILNNSSVFNGTEKWNQDKLNKNEIIQVTHQLIDENCVVLFFYINTQKHEVES